MATGCSKPSGLPAGLRGDGIQITDVNLQSQIVQALEESGIPVIVEDGIFRYLQSDTAEVRNIMRSLIKGSNPNPYDKEAEVAVNEQHLEVYKRLFEQAGVPYKIKEFDGYYNVQWRLQYAEQVDQIVENAGFEFYESVKDN